MSDNPQELLDLTAEIVSAFVANNNIAPGDLGKLIADTFAALGKLGGELRAPATSLVPAVAIKMSVTRNAIICLEDGKSFKSLKKHLRMLGMTPDEYRVKWGLPHDYPMVAASYSEKRSAMAKSFGLGRSPSPPMAPTQEPATNPKRGRPKVIK